jgi:hypothetical protein
MLKQKVAQNVTNYWGCFNFKNNHISLPKLAQLAKIDQSGHPEFGLPLKYKTRSPSFAEKGTVSW